MCKDIYICKETNLCTLGNDDTQFYINNCNIHIYIYIYIYIYTYVYVNLITALQSLLRHGCVASLISLTMLHKPRCIVPSVKHR